MTAKRVRPGISRRSQRLSGITGFAFLMLVGLGLVGCDQSAKAPKHPVTETSGTEREHQVSHRAQDQSPIPASPPSVAPDPVLKAEKDLMSPSESAKWGAVDLLVEDGSARAIDVLAAYIESLPLDSTREEVVRRASTVSDKRAMPAVLELLSGAKDPSVFRMAQEIFNRLADAEAVQDILDRYDGSTDVEVRTRLAKTISLTSAEEAVEPLRLVVLGEGQQAGDGMVLAGASALARIGTQPAIDTLLERLNTEQTDEGRYLIAARLAEVRSPSAETTLQGAALGGGKFSTQPQTRITAIRALLHHPSAETQETLRVLANDPQSEISTAATEILTEIQKRLGQ